MNSVLKNGSYDNKSMKFKKIIIKTSPGNESVNIRIKHAAIK